MVNQRCVFQEDKSEEKGGIEVHQIRSVKVSRGRHIPKAFEIFTDNKSYVLKAKVKMNCFCGGLSKELK